MTPMAQSAEITLAQLKASIAKKGDFPSLSADLNRILSTMQDQDMAEEQMVNVVLGDFALAQKVIRLANSAMYSAFGGNITTISMAIYVLGANTVGHLAFGLKLLDGLDQAVDTSAAREELSKSVIAGAVARNVGSAVSGKDGEAVAVVTLIRGLGKVLTCFYLPELFEQVEASKPSVDQENEAARTVMGLSFDELAKEVLLGWKLPAELTAPVIGNQSGQTSHMAWVTAVSEYSRRYVAAVSNGGDTATLQQLAQRYAETIGTTANDLSAQANSAIETLQANDPKSGAGAFLTERRKLLQARAQEADEAPGTGAAALAAGIMEMEKAMSVLSLSQLLNMATEILSRGLKGSRLMLFLRNKPTASYNLVMGRGDGVAEKVKRLGFEEAFSPNVVHFALSKAMPVYLNDTFDEKIASRIPPWLKSAFPQAKSMLLIPLMANNQPAGVLYIDWGATGKAGMPREEMSLVERLRELVGASLTKALVRT